MQIRTNRDKSVFRFFLYVVPQLLILLISSSSCETHNKDKVLTCKKIKERPNQAECCLQNNYDTSGFFYPKVDLKSLRFGFSYRGKLCFKIRKQNIFGDFVKETGFCEDKYDYYTGDLTEQQEQWILKRCDEARIPLWGVFNPRTYETELLPFRGITLAIGETSSFVGILGAGRRLLDWKEPEDARIAKVLVLPCSTSICAQQMHEKEKDEEVLKTIRTFVKEQILDARLEDCYKVYITYPTKIAHVITFYLGKEKVLALLNKHGSTYAFSAMRLKRAESRFGGMILEHEDPSWDTAMYNTHVFILPDIDGNGSNEIYIDSTVSYIMSILPDIQESAILEEIQSFYVGP